jgi:hypothetical protein
MNMNMNLKITSKNKFKYNLIDKNLIQEINQIKAIQKRIIIIFDTNSI